MLRFLERLSVAERTVASDVTANRQAMNNGIPIKVTR
jgi:hypothetical protein